MEVNIYVYYDNELGCISISNNEVTYCYKCRDIGCIWTDEYIIDLQLAEEYIENANYYEVELKEV